MAINPDMERSWLECGPDQREKEPDRMRPVIEDAGTGLLLQDLREYSPGDPHPRDGGNECFHGADRQRPTMPRQIRISGAAVLRLALLAALPAHGADSGTAAAVSFSKDIAPILQQKCVTCHDPKKAKGGYQLNTFAALLKPGKSGEPPFKASDPAGSHLFQLLIATDEDDRMPQKDDPLPAPQIALIERWIKDGARFDGPDPGATLASLFAPAVQPDPPVRYRRPVPILALAFSPDGGKLAASGYHEVTVWNPTNGTLVHRINNIARQTQALAYSPDGSMLAVGGGTPGRLGELKLVNSTTDSEARTLGVTTDCLLALNFSPDGKRIVAGGADNAIRLYDVATGREERHIEQHADWIIGLAFSPDGAHFASASRDKTARLFETKTGELEETYDGHSQPVFGIAFSHDGKRIFSAGRDREVHAWNIKDAKKVFEFGGAGGEVLRILVADEQLFSCAADTVRQHKLAGKKAELVRTYAGHRDVVYALAHHAPTKRLASGSFDGEVRLWDAESGISITNFIAAPGFVE
jgi:hypothetical protein